MSEASGGALFRDAGIAMVRAPVHPVGAAAGVRPDTGPGDDEAARLTRTLRELADEPLVREAVALSSPSLAAVLHRVLTGSQTVPLPQLRRSVRALTSYRLRMSTRATPFGLMAGVAPARFGGPGEAAKVRWGGAHTRAVRPDREWLTGLIASWERRPGVLRHLRVVGNALCAVRGDRLVLPYVPQSAREDLPEGGSDGAAPRLVHEVSVRHTVVVQAVRELARRPVRGAELARALLERFPGATDEAVDRVLSELVGKEILLTDARPPLEAADPLRHIQETCADVPGADLPELEELGAVGAALETYAAAGADDGPAALADVTARMRRLYDLPRPLQVDLALDAEVQLPAAVADEAARAAELLWRMGPKDTEPDYLREYREAFLERYGTSRLVPVAELLDPDTGLAAPAGYLRPPSPRYAAPAEADRERDLALAELAQQALMDGSREVVLDDDHPVVRRLSRTDGSPPKSLELNANLLADSCEALDAGNFRLVTVGGSQQAGALLGRFGYLLDDAAAADLAAVAREAATGDGGAVPVQVAFRTGRSRDGNVAQVPPWLPHLLPVGCFADPDDPGVLDPRRLAVGADHHRMYLVDTASGRRVEPTVFHVLNRQANLPNAARFVCDLAGSGVRAWRTWHWGPAAGALPYLPRVRYGRTVLTTARWRPAAELRDGKLPFADWLLALHRWRERWRVPSRVRVAAHDRGVQLDLDLPGHPEILRHELLRNEDAELREVPTDAAGSPDGWLSGADGAHHTEVVIPLWSARPSPLPSVTVPCAPRRTGSGVHLPGGEWLYAALYAPAERHEELLAVHLHALLNGLPAEVDRWFFLRYRDAHGAHLRIRFHAPPEVLAGQLLPQLHAAAGTLRSSRLVGRVVWDTYDPELERYGGPEAIAAAERVFHADSVAVLEHLRRRYRRQDDTAPPLLAAAGYADLARAFHSSRDGTGAAGGEGAAWLLRAVPKDEERQRAFRMRRREALPLVDPYREGPAPAADEELRAAWAHRAQAVDDYGRLLRDLGARSWSDTDQALHAVLHMHHNRRVGVDREAETFALAVARGAAQAHTDRRRHGR
ncbi:lantibiotic dehydratase [Streptomyces pinistramenti]|uniref:lantibiotic dehydratase n=1 Tax=Streptomyces pinistramenti TaxID=2884812 RepID=UPI001D06419B|nr:lantibiotic dehydratase [Streptomyces pinistramenti]MCB5906070.1 lantibiotic dehydratase [Streptomyces pinistramenti]